jgi:hypothetical protein
MDGMFKQVRVDMIHWVGSHNSSKVAQSISSIKVLVEKRHLPPPLLRPALAPAAALFREIVDASEVRGV